MLGGYFADKVIGFRWAVVVGASLMTLGHAAMAVETEFSIIGWYGFFWKWFFQTKPLIVSEMYKDRPEKKDGCVYIVLYGCKCWSVLWDFIMRLFR
jgi:POT family proton-dependent oligopeptide transporter